MGKRWDNGWFEERESKEERHRAKEKDEEEGSLRDMEMVGFFEESGVVGFAQIWEEADEA